MFKSTRVNVAINGVAIISFAKEGRYITICGAPAYIT